MITPVRGEEGATVKVHCGDLALLAAIGQLYGRGDPAQDLYCLAQYGCNLELRMDPEDVEIGLGLLGLDAFRVVAPGLAVPGMVGFALGQGHVVLAQIRADHGAQHDRWVCLTDADGETWHGIVTGWDLIAQGVRSSLGYTLTGHYVCLAAPIPGWDTSDPC